MTRATTPAWSRRFDRATLALAYAAGAGLLFMVATIATAVIMRYVAGTPLLGVNEVVQLTAVAVAMLALPYCTDERAHVRVDVLDNAIGPRGRWFGDALSRLLSGAVLSVLAWRSALKALDAWEYADTTNMLGLPIWPFYALIALGIALCVLVLAEQLLLILVTGRELE
ncbi:TRAP transporter small permease [Amaricoccus solimangrovi]|uniref:TRAP transporter small permease protein n=1 Tax=Amaricoccus solimangrovi TaxID=2589815 RepID=A0A501W938_9RHOB|nr:TRAP transporter small permease [Amaricoccus solimangrovi]TPE43801.1 TRAP transporter small permease [Amaricoccus solimangrovi]